jgi:hypothetical protein
MRDPVPFVVPMILDRPTCLECIATKNGITVREVETALSMIADTVKVYRNADRCRVCGETKDVASVRRVTPR